MTARPDLRAPFCSQRHSYAGWIIFCEEDYYGPGADRWFAIHEDSGDVRDLHLYAPHARGHVVHAVDFERLIDLDFPVSARGYSSEQIEAMWLDHQRAAPRRAIACLAPVAALAGLGTFALHHALTFTPL